MILEHNALIIIIRRLMKKQSLVDLIQSLEKELIRLGYTNGSIQFYRNQWRALLQFARKKGEAFYSEQLGVDFIEDFNWGGTFGETKDGLPYIGKSPEYDNALFVLGFGGNGITFSAQAMEIIPALLRGKEHPLAPYYQFGR